MSETVANNRRNNSQHKKTRGIDTYVRKDGVGEVGELAIRKNSRGMPYFPIWRRRGTTGRNELSRIITKRATLAKEQHFNCIDSRSKIIIHHP